MHVVLKKGGTTITCNKKNELIPICIVTGWRMDIDYQKLNLATWRDHFPLPFIDQMLERLAEQAYYYFLGGYLGSTKLLYILLIKRKPRSHAHSEFLRIKGCPSDYVTRQQRSKGSFFLFFMT